ncbi:MAG: hypothetical protein EP344_18225, partial [Bacteroidetes bacterium]
MKQNLLFCLLLVFGSTLFAQQTIYVKFNATGGNNGTSWTDAYNNLYDATSGANPGDQIWVAAGTYTPDPGTANSSFVIQAGVEMYGGFSGTETMLSQRDPDNNIVTLDGDFNGDDIAGDFTQNRTDNARHIIQVVASAEPNDRAVVDGFVIVGGNTLTGSASPDLARRGGGILTEAKLTARNCAFSDNYADSGSGIAAIGSGSGGLMVDNCYFDSNEVLGQCAGVYMREIVSGTIKNSQFLNNKTNRGCIYPQSCSDILIDSCLIENNDAGANFGAALFVWQSVYTMTNTTIRNNKAANACGVYNDGREGTSYATIDNCLFEGNMAGGFGAGFYNWQGNVQMTNTTFKGNISNNATAIYNDGRLFLGSEVTFDHCVFEDNEALDYGGTGLYAWKSNYTMTNTVFRGNKAGNSAAAIYNGDTTNYLIKGCLFENHLANFGGAIANYGGGNDGTIDSCTFRNNMANTSGGAMTTGFTAQVEVVNSLYDGNQARFGGAIFNQNDYTSLTIRGTTFSGNTADNNGGAINISSGITFTLEDSHFELNTADFGGALEISEDSLDLSVATIDNCIFQDNFALTQAAGLNLNDADVTITNSLLIQNLNIGVGAGGGLINNAAANKTANVTIINSTIANNTAAIGAGIAQWENTAEGGEANLVLQNTVLSNAVGGIDYEVEEGDPAVTS